MVDALDAPYVPMPFKDQMAYFAAVGELIIAYASVEGVIHTAVRRLSGVDEKLARGIFGGMRITVMCDKLRRVAAVKETQEIQDEIAAVFSQLTVIAKERDRIAHRGGSPTPDGLSVSNVLICKNIDMFETHTFCLDDLNAMIDDLNFIYFRLLMVALHHEMPNALTLAEAFRVPWRYKPSPPK